MTSPSLKGRRILIVEDEYFIASDLKRVLESVEADVIGPVGDLASGLDLAHREALDAAILDVNLEGTLSYRLADYLEQQHVPHAFVTGYDGWSMPEVYRDRPRITKPFTDASVLAAVAALCGNASR
ncbi:response regulator [Sphingomonas radiodurans]|uniref:response regulator n=1 Tax=Sphingomonas radiodurans TaxID=2890321 RepID=UPI001E2DB023|nr:response regulator [Sphingomonas radiodurans]WBH15344.1 response regulator [Sphingomonas radiodurans]